MKSTYRTQAKAKFGFIFEQHSLDAREETLVRRLISAYEPEFSAQLFVRPNQQEMVARIYADLKLPIQPLTLLQKEDLCFAFVLGDLACGRHWAKLFPTRVIGSLTENNIGYWRYWNPNFDGPIEKSDSFSLERASELKDQRAQFFLYEGEELCSHKFSPLLPSDSQTLPSFSSPLISVIVPLSVGSYEVLRLAHALKDQSYPHFEVIFVLNNLADHSLRILNQAEAVLRARRVRSMRITLDRDPESLADALNIGARASRGDFISVQKISGYPDQRFFSLFAERKLRDDTLYVSHLVARSNKFVDARDLSLPFDRFSARALEKQISKSSDFLTGNGIVLSRNLFERCGAFAQSNGKEFSALAKRAAGLGAGLEVFPGLHTEITP